MGMGFRLAREMDDGQRVRLRGGCRRRRRGPRSVRNATRGAQRARGGGVRQGWIGSTVVGTVAAFCTTVSYVPQLKKCWETGSAGDLSLKMFSTLAAGVAL
jgi:PQ loop repeat